ncbi:MAG: hypothetical protein ACKVU2_11355 [Saprospiraceae bacterium]
MNNNTLIGLAAAAFSLLFVFFAPQDKSEVNALVESTMAIHDAAMAEMGEMNRLSRALQRQLTTLDSLAPQADSVRVVLRSIKRAEEDMFDWMRGYEAPAADMPAEEALRYLKGQHAAISQNQRDIRAAIEAGKQLQRHR